MELDRRRHKTVRETFSSRNDQSPYKTNMIIFVIGQIYNNVCVCVGRAFDNQRKETSSNML